MILLLLATVLLTVSCGKKETSSELTEITEDALSEPESASKEEPEEVFEELCVHVCGAVKVPGVYRLPAGSRLYEAIQLAGGMTEEASEEALNQAALVEDGQQIYIPTKEEVSSPGNGLAGQSPEADDGKININTADKEQLMTLTGIGDAKAELIIQYREEHGGFQSIEELMEIDGIKEGVFQKISGQIKI